MDLIEDLRARRLNSGFTVCSFSFSAGDPDILEWDEKCWRCADWAEIAECKKVVGWEDCGDPAEFIYQENPDLQQYRWGKDVGVSYDSFTAVKQHGVRKWKSDCVQFDINPRPRILFTPWCGYQWKRLIQELICLGSGGGGGEGGG